MVRRFLIVFLAGALAAACTKPDAKSGGDAYRNEAKPLKLGKWVTDSVARSKGDATDWKAFVLAAPGPAAIDLHADNPAAVIEVAVYNRYGIPLASGVRRANQASVKVRISGKRAGRYFVMIRETHGPPTPYTIRASQGAGGGGVIRPNF